MKIKELFPSDREIERIVTTAESVIYGSGSRAADRAVITSAIREVLHSVLCNIELNIEVKAAVSLDK